MISASVNVPEKDREFFSTRPILSSHNLHELPYFNDSELIDLLDEMPRTHLRVWTSDDEPGQFTKYSYVDTTDIRGQDILDCVLRGKFWINLQRVDKFFDRFKDISSALYNGLTAQCPHLQINYVHSYLLLSSPSMYFQLHVDSYENMFWCIRGGKKFYLYPPDERRVATQEFMEDICSGIREDFLPHKKETEFLRKEFQVAPGDMLSWPQHSPHEFENNSLLNVGLGTFHGTQSGTNRVLNYQSSHYLREHWPAFRGEVNHDALSTRLKRNLYRGVRKFRHTPAPKKIEFWTSYRLDPELPGCMSRIEDGPILAEFSRLSS